MPSLFCEADTKDTTITFRPRGLWRLEQLSEIQRCLRSLPPPGSQQVVLDGKSLEQLDTAAAMLLIDHLHSVGTSLDSAQIENFSELHLKILELAYKSFSPSTNKQIAKQGLSERIGRSFEQFTEALGDGISFVGESSTRLFEILHNPKRLRSKELVVQLETTGLSAVPIVCLVTFLIGIVVAYISGVQLERYGANIFIVDGVGLAMTRELSPILVAIIVAGRSGSAFTAQIGAMKLNEEVDAIATLGLSRMQVLVIPRLLALMIAMPCLVFIGDITGILGGLLISDLRLGVSATTFLERMQSVLALKHVWVGLFKAPVFAFFIAAIGCQMGLKVKNNARSLGESTTSTVVRSIVVVVLLNALFSVIFSELGI